MQWFNSSFLYFVWGSNLEKRSSHKLKEPEVLKKKRMQYSIEDLARAVAAIIDGKKSIGSAAREFNIPPGTLSDRINGKHPKKVGQPTFLTDEEESSLISYLKYMGSHGFPINIKQICAYGSAILLQSDQPERFCITGLSEKWWRNFKKRHHEDIIHLKYQKIQVKALRD